MKLQERLWSLRGPLAAAAFALVFALVLFSRGHPYDLDQLGLGLPYARIFNDAVRAHRFPLWTHLVWCGYPVHAEGQGGFLAFPFRLAAALAPGDEVNGMEVELTLALVLAAFAGGLAARLLGRSHLASGAAGVVWALGGGLLSYQENPAVLEACWAMPLLFALPPPRSGGGSGRGYVPLGGAFLGLQLLAGWPYAFALTVPLLAFTWRWRPLAVAVGLGLLVGAAQWIPTAELFLDSDRAAGLSPVEIMGRGGFRFGDLVRIVSPAIPPADRITERSVVFVYLGLPAVVLALAGFWHSVRARRFVLPGALVVALVVALLPAVAPSLAAKLVSLPPLSFVRGPSKLLIVFGLAASLLLAEGIDSLPRGARLAVLLVGLDLFQFGQRRALPVERALFRTTPDVARAIPPGARTVVLQEFSVYWTKELDAAFFRKYSGLEPNVNVLWGIPLVSGYGPLALGRTKLLAERPAPERLARAGAELLVACESIRGFAQVGTFTTTRLHRLEGAVPFARLASDAVVTSSSTQAFLLAAKLPPSTAILEAPLAHTITEGTARVLRQDEDAIDVAVASAGTALLVVPCSYAPGWEARVDGASAPVVRADFAFMAVPLPAGAKRVELRYAPASFRTGLAFSALGLVALFGLALRRKPAARPGPT